MSLSRAPTSVKAADVTKLLNKRSVTDRPMWNVAVPPTNSNPNPKVTGPDYHQNLVISSTAHVPPFYRIL